MTQQQFKRNLRLINWLAGLNNASFFVPFAVPFWLDGGLNQQEIYLLQSVFTVTMMLLEVPTGMLADRIGRRTTLMLAGATAAVGFTLYSVAHGFWQFALAEIVLGLGLSMNSGTVASMRHESALALEGDHGRSSAGKAQSAALLSAALCAVTGGLVVELFGFRVAMALDALTYVGAATIAFRMAEPPHSRGVSSVKLRTAWPLVTSLLGLLMLFALLREATHIPVFLNARVLETAGVGVGWYGAVFAGLQLWGSVVARHGHRLEARMGERRTALLLAGMAVGSYLATGQLPAQMAPLGLIGFATLFALSMPFVNHALNSRIANDGIRATVNSCATLLARGLYLVAGPLVGTMVDAHGVQYALTSVGVVLALLSIWPLWRSLKMTEGR